MSSTKGHFEAPIDCCLTMLSFALYHGLVGIVIVRAGLVGA